MPVAKFADWAMRSQPAGDNPAWQVVQHGKNSDEPKGATAVWWHGGVQYRRDDEQCCEESDNQAGKYASGLMSGGSLAQLNDSWWALHS